MPYSQTNLVVLPVTSVDRQLFRWTDRPISDTPMHIPLFASIGDDRYLITDFDTTSSVCAGSPAKSYTDALSMSINEYGADTVTMSEWVAIAGVARNIGADLSSLPMPRQVQNSSNIFTGVLYAASGWPQELTGYLDIKKIPWRTMHLLVFMTADQIAYIADFTVQTNPSAQTFKQFIETVRDFSAEITGTQYDEAEFKAITNRKGAAHTDIDSRLESVAAKIAPASVQNKDSFESPRVFFTFSITSYDDYALILKKLETAREDVASLYARLKEQGMV